MEARRVGFCTGVVSYKYGTAIFAIVNKRFYFISVKPRFFWILKKYGNPHFFPLFFGSEDLRMRRHDCFKTS